MEISHAQEEHVAAPEKIPLGMSGETQQRNEEPEDDEIEKFRLKALGSAEGKDDPPALVIEASQKLIDQRRPPVIPEENPSKATTVLGGPSRFPPYAEYAELDEKAEALPDIIHIPFEVSTEDVTLVGWEDLWFSEAELDIGKYGKINEPKIDFVYTCGSLPKLPSCIR